jgi:hypothetical protein
MAQKLEQHTNRLEADDEGGPPEWGLCALLTWAKTHPCDAEVLEASVYEGAPSFGGLLWAARRWKKEPQP